MLHEFSETTNGNQHNGHRPAAPPWAPRAPLRQRRAELLRLLLDELGALVLPRHYPQLRLQGFTRREADAAIDDLLDAGGSWSRTAPTSAWSSG